jgi:hypothetical protein
MQHKKLSKEIKKNCLTSIELRKSPFDLLSAAGVDHHLESRKDRQKISDYCYKRKLSRINNPEAYTAVCFENGVDIDLINLLISELLEEETPTKLQSASEETQEEKESIMSARLKKEEGYEDDTSILKALLGKAKSPLPPTPTIRPTNSMNRQSSVTRAKQLHSAGGTAIIMDRERSEIPVDSIVDGDTETPWSPILGGLFTLIQGIEKKMDNQEHGMNAYELLVTCPDPRDADVRSLQIVDDGTALLLTCESIPKYNLEDAEGLTTRTVELIDQTLAVEVRCQKAKKTYKTLMTRLRRNKENVMRIKILLSEKVCVDFLNPGSVDGLLDMNRELVNHEFDLDEETFDLPVLKLSWQVAIEESIHVIDDSAGMKKITKGLSKLKMAPKRKTPSK